MTLSQSAVHLAAICALTAASCALSATPLEAQAMPEPRCAVVDSSMAPTKADQSPASAPEEIYALLAAWRAALREGNIASVTALVTEDAEFWSQGAAPLVGRAALGDAFRPFFTSYQLLQEFDCHELVVRGDMAFMRGLERNRLIPRDGGETVEIQQRAFSIIRRDLDGRWRFSRGMTNEPPTP
jgi:uncharacterized protein (TIGR02246 family)